MEEIIVKLRLEIWKLITNRTLHFTIYVTRKLCIFDGTNDNSNHFFSIGYFCYQIYEFWIFLSLSNCFCVLSVFQHLWREQHNLLQVLLMIRFIIFGFYSSCFLFYLKSTFPCKLQIILLVMFYQICTNLYHVIFDL